MGLGLTFVIESQPYLNAVLMPLGPKVMCFKACTHYPTLFDHFQRELREVLQDLQNKSLLQDWCQPQSWKQLKTLANSEMQSESKWKQMGELAMSNGRLDMAEDCLNHVMNLSELLPLYASLGEAEEAEGISKFVFLASCKKIR
ncbi:uncharacterized protein LOC130951343 [Arachis stenosperma]|uniref:uncharacterized protein LOC130951343 n=1 Tax=Arachis stenosperma TaxID=217475 RepID=UPI0025AC0FCE|nr:uncharacterized protein LOC130951343 [Arachis stenosperma]